MVCIGSLKRKILKIHQKRTHKQTYIHRDNQPSSDSALFSSQGTEFLKEMIVFRSSVDVTGKNN
jgi:hypothetical protein